MKLFPISLPEWYLNDRFKDELDQALRDNYLSDMFLTYCGMYAEVDSSGIGKVRAAYRSDSGFMLQTGSIDVADVKLEADELKRFVNLRKQQIAKEIYEKRLADKVSREVLKILNELKFEDA